MSIDSSQVDKLAADLEKVPAEQLPRFKQVVAKGALNIKNWLRADAAGHRHFPYFPNSISYDMVGELEAEIGPDKDRIQGALGNLLYFGRSNTGGVLSFDGPADREAPRFSDALADVAEDIL